MWRRGTTEKGTGSSPRSLPPPSPSRLQASLDEKPFDLTEFVEKPKEEGETVLYLAYGSNLCRETFRGKRGIEPVSQINVQVPSLRVAFDLPAVPYLEPCMANSSLRDADDNGNEHNDSETFDNEKAHLLNVSRRKDRYRKDRWHKGLVGAVYEVTAKDYAHIIATEGGGASYQDITVDCFPFATADPNEPVPWHPTQPAFKAHTLFAPSLPPEDPRGRVKRPDASYAQASARYLKLINDGAAELGLPMEYQNYLQSLRPYRITTFRQRLGKMAFLLTWVPIIFSVFGLGKIFADKKGRMPDWLVRLSSTIFKGMWRSYDMLFKPVFGDGERTITDGEDDDETRSVPEILPPRNEMASVVTVEVEDAVAKVV